MPTGNTLKTVTKTQNLKGEWVIAIPEPYYLAIRKECEFRCCIRDVKVIHSVPNRQSVV